MTAKTLKDAVDLARCYLAGGDSPPLHADTTRAIAQALVHLDLLMENVTRESTSRLSTIAELEARITKLSEPVPVRLICPGTNPDGSPCARLHLDEGEFAAKVHHTHACQHCGHVWRPAIIPTVGVQFLPGFRNA